MKDSIRFKGKAAQAAFNMLRKPFLNSGETLEEKELKYAQGLATFMWEKYYKEDAPNWKPLNDVLGVLTQIDNMVAGMTRMPSNTQECDNKVDYSRCAGEPE